MHRATIQKNALIESRHSPYIDKMHNCPVKYRSRIDIVANILESASNRPIPKTRLMYAAYLSHEEITRYAVMLIQSDLLGFDTHSHLFFATTNGKKFLELYYRMKQCITIDEFEEQLYKSKITHYWQNELKSLSV